MIWRGGGGGVGMLGGRVSEYDGEGWGRKWGIAGCRGGGLMRLRHHDGCSRVFTACL